MKSAELWTGTKGIPFFGKKNPGTQQDCRKGQSPLWAVSSGPQTGNLVPESWVPHSVFPHPLCASAPWFTILQALILASSLMDLEPGSLPAAL